MRQGWDDEAANWAAFARTPGRDRAHENINLPALLGLLPGPGRATLDLACGEGRLSRVLAARGHRVVGIDASPALVRLTATHEASVPALLGDATRLPFPGGTFDLVVAYMCLHDIDNLDGAVAEAGRVLAPGGRLCLAIPHPLSTAGSFTSRDGTAPFVISGSYLDPAPLTMTAEREGMRLTFHSEHRPLEVYMGALEAAGLLTETIREVAPGDDVVALDRSQRRWRRVPLFLHVRAVRPEQPARADGRGSLTPPR
jgi:SAM-dependent methyltransferase